MGRGEEKPMIEVAGRPMISRVTEALSESGYVNRIIVVVSRWTPMTERWAEEKGLEVCRTLQEGFVEDALQAIRGRGLGDVIVCSADLPLLDGSLIRAIVERYLVSGKSALTTVASLESLSGLGVQCDSISSISHQGLVPVGLNILSGRHIDEEEMEEEKFLVEDASRVLNVNSQEELLLAEKLLARRSS